MSGATAGKVSILRDDTGKMYYQNQRVGYFMPTNKCDYTFIQTLMRTPLFIVTFSFLTSPTYGYVSYTVAVALLKYIRPKQFSHNT